MSTKNLDKSKHIRKIYPLNFYQNAKNNITATTVAVKKRFYVQTTDFEEEEELWPERTTNVVLCSFNRQIVMQSLQQGGAAENFLVPFTRRGENIPLSKTFLCNKTLIFPRPLCDCVFYTLQETEKTEKKPCNTGYNKWGSGPRLQTGISADWHCRRFSPQHILDVNGNRSPEDTLAS